MANQSPAAGRRVPDRTKHRQETSSPSDSVLNVVLMNLVYPWILVASKATAFREYYQNVGNL